MVLKVAATAVTTILPSRYYLHAVLALVSVLVVRAFAQGRRTNRERDLHARVIIVTGGFTPLGLTLLHQLATRGAHIIALTPLSPSSPKISILVDLLRSTTSNEHIYAEECDLSSPHEIREFCTKFLSAKGMGTGMGVGDAQRLDGIVFGHEYRHIGSFFSASRKDVVEAEEKERKEASLGTFLATTLLLPALLVAPVERDIRIINIVNPFYAAAAPTFSPSPSTPPPSSSSPSRFLLEGTRSLRTVILTRHLQRILDALPSAAQVPRTDDNSTGGGGGGGGIPKSQKSNIVAVSVCPGISRTDTVAPLLGAGSSRVGSIIYYLLQPLFRLLFKSPHAALQSVLHALFLPTPFKSKSGPVKSKPLPDSDALPEEVLKPGALYRECAIVRLRVPVVDDPLKDQGASASATNNGKGKGKEKEREREQEMELPDDGELGGEVTGRLVWEDFEKELKEWEEANPPPPPLVGGNGGRSGTPPEVDIDTSTAAAA